MCRLCLFVPNFVSLGPGSVSKFPKCIQLRYTRFQLLFDPQGQAGKKKWSKGKTRDKLQNLVLFNKETHKRLLKEIPKVHCHMPDMLLQNCVRKRAASRHPFFCLPMFASNPPARDTNTHTHTHTPTEEAYYPKLCFRAAQDQR